MKIMVIDDLEINLQAAKAQLGDEHELLLVDSHVIASERLHDYEGDIVLTDLLMPLENNGAIHNGGYYDDNYGAMVPVGLALAIEAAIHAKIRAIGLLTDTNHHVDLITQITDNLLGHNLVINGVHVRFSQHNVAEFKPNDLANPVGPGLLLASWEPRPGNVKAKDWRGFMKSHIIPFMKP